MIHIHKVSVSRKAIYQHGIKDLYADHKLIYSMFECTRTPEDMIASKPSGFSWLALPETPFGKSYLVVSDRPAHDLPDIKLESKIVPDSVFTRSEPMAFKIKISPVVRKRTTDVKKSGPVIVLRGQDEITDWFKERARVNGFEAFDIELGGFETHVVKKGDKKIVVPSIFIKGGLRVLDQEKFKETYKNGMGRAKAYGCGLIQLFPLKQCI